jgi:Virulence factor BrkB
VLDTVPLPWSELVRRTWREVVDDDVLGLAAQLSYYFFLALFPAILFLLALASFFPLFNITDDVGRSLSPFVSPQVLELIQEPSADRTRRATVPPRPSRSWAGRIARGTTPGRPVSFEEGRSALWRS